MNMLKESLEQARAWMAEAAAAAKCWPCGCLHNTLQVLQTASQDLPEEAETLRGILAAGRVRLRPVEYECLGCATCFPALAANALAEALPERAATLAACPTEIPVARTGWPPLPGEYLVLRYQAPVAIATLTDEVMVKVLAERQPEGVTLVGRLQTENLGIERVIQNTLANPYIRFLILCGSDSAQQVGHRPGQSLQALARNGLDRRGRIIGSLGKRPVIRNVSREAVETFRSQVDIVDLIGCQAVPEIVAAAAACLARDPGPATPFVGFSAPPRTLARPPDHLNLDPGGYFVIFPDHRRGTLFVEHYQNSGVLNHILEGKTAPDLYTTAIELGLLTRLDHAAYLGKELARAEHSIRRGEPYVQDAAPEPQPSHSCACDASSPNAVAGCSTSSSPP